MPVRMSLVLCLAAAANARLPAAAAEIPSFTCSYNDEAAIAMTDVRDRRIIQVRHWPLATALSRVWGDDEEVLYLNFPRFFRLGEPELSRLEDFERARRFSPEMRVRV